MEDWRVIPTFPIYEICEDGRVRNKSTGKYLKITYPMGTGIVQLYYKGKIHWRSVGLLVEKIFGKKRPSRNRSSWTKCKICGSSVPKSEIQEHEKNCTPRQQGVEYFNY